ncbi:hypothetical protein Moror_1086 [Moniliophthora roreri MCA 2997]|uniref:Uncharacterized protein n=1 Tax=Moniliophthora roreri (strain MCA 2997) TaxID=1381753 RepID=V2XL07_MONRO|nr:hypothetical protein Moror_1086 [Moniliophthora roreri MCA 2997]
MASPPEQHDSLQDSTVNIDIETAEPIPFPSLTQASEAAQSISPGASDTSAFTSSDKLSALPQNMNSPNLNRSGRSSGHQSPRLFRHSMDASRSWPSIATEGQGQGWNAFNNPGREVPKPSDSEGSVEGGTKGRNSLESDRGSFSGVHSVRRAFRRLSRTSDPTVPSPALRGSPLPPDTVDKEAVVSDSASHSRSRAVSPIRILQQWSANLTSLAHGGHHDNEEPFIPIDPFHFDFRLIPSFLSSLLSSSGQKPEEPAHSLAVFQSAPAVESQLPPTPDGTCTQYFYPDRMHRIQTSSWSFFTDSLPRMVYLHLLLRLPSMYFSRVARIFEDAEVSKPDIQRMMEGCFGGAAVYTDAPNDRNNRSRTTTFGAGNGNLNQGGRVDVAESAPPLPAYTSEEWPVPRVTPALRKFKHSWEDFVDSLLREWKTLNVVSALLLSAILTMFQVPDAAYDPITRTAALLSLVCAIMSLSYGCMYIVRFGTMRSMYRASRWAEEAQKSKTFLLWNVWVLLAMPAVWMSWSMILFVVSILSFVWRTGAVDDPQQREGLSPTGILGPRIAITTVFAIGLLYLIAIIRTLKSYGRIESIEERKGSRFYAHHHQPPSRMNPPSRRGAGAGDDRRGRGMEGGTIPLRRSIEQGRGNTAERARGRSHSVSKRGAGTGTDPTDSVKTTPKGAPVGLGLSGMNANNGNVNSIVGSGTVRGSAENRKMDG